MADAALRLMTVDEFLHWDAEGHTRYQLFDGVPVSMAPPAGVHTIIVANLARRIGEALDRRPPCHARVEAGIVPVNRNRSYYQADLAVTCRRARPDEVNVLDPILVVEVLSRSTQREDRGIKLPDYQLIPSVQEILLVDPEHPHCEVLRRFDGGLWTIEIVRDMEASVPLTSIDLDLPMAQIYVNVTQGD